MLGDIAAGDATLAILRGVLDAELSEIRARHEPKITEIEASLKAKKDAIEAWARQARAFQHCFDEKKSLDMKHGTIGFKLGPPSLGLFTDWEWPRVLSVLVKAAGRCKRWAKYVRWKPELDKRALLKDALAEKLQKHQLLKWGLKVSQAETFHIELKD